MKTGTRRGRRSYHSPLREQQAAATRDRILAALVRVMAEGVTELSVPAVAREAGVSVATVYRHFPDKEALLEALTPYFGRLSGMDERMEVPTDWPGFRALIRRLFAAYERFDELARAAMVSQLGRDAREKRLPARVEFSRAALANVAPDLDDEALERVNRLGLVLVSSASYRMYEALGLTAEEAAEHVLWAIRTAIDAEERT